jgi:hypothetical protein
MASRDLVSGRDPARRFTCRGACRGSRWRSPRSASSGCKTSARPMRWQRVVLLDPLQSRTATLAGNWSFRTILPQRKHSARSGNPCTAPVRGPRTRGCGSLGFGERHDVVRRRAAGDHRPPAPERPGPPADRARHPVSPSHRWHNHRPTERPRPWPAPGNQTGTSRRACTSAEARTTTS